MRWWVIAQRFIIREKVVCQECVEVIMPRCSVRGSARGLTQLRSEWCHKCAASEDRTHDLRIMRPTRCQLRYRRHDRCNSAAAVQAVVAIRSWRLQAQVFPVRLPVLHLKRSAFGCRTARILLHHNLATSSTSDALGETRERWRRQICRCCCCNC